MLLPAGMASADDAPAAAGASSDAVFPRTPMWVYGHSYTVTPGLTNTPGREWMPAAAAELGLPAWQSFGVRSSRLIDNYGDIARQAARSPVRDSAWSSSRRGVVVLQSEFNDMINPAPGNVPRAVPLTSTAVGNYGQTLQAALATLSSSARADWSSARSSGQWAASTGPAYLGGSLVWTTTPGAYREMTVDVGESGTVWVVTWDVSRAISNPHNGATAISVDGRSHTVVPARTAAWEPVWSVRGGGYQHTVGPRATRISGLAPGRHVIRVTKSDRGPGAVCLDQLLVHSSAPPPVVVVGDPAPQTSGHWVTTPANRPVVLANQQRLNGQLDVVTRQFRNVTMVSLVGAGSQHMGSDGLHLSDRGMEYEAGLIAESVRRHVTVYDVPAMYQ